MISMKTKGPATAPTVPGHGSTSHRAAKMNKAISSTAAPAALVMDLESPIADAGRMASILSRMLTDAVSRDLGANGAYHLTNTQREDMLFAAYHTEELIRRIFAKWEELA